MMKKVVKSCLAFIILFFVITSLKLNAYAESMSSGQGVDSYKVWTIKFNDDIELDKISQSYIKVLDSKGIPQNVKLDLSEDKKSIKVNPDSKGYKPGEKYTLKITKGLKSKRNKNLKKEVSVDFYIAQDENDNIKEDSINNPQNRSLVVQDTQWIYYSNLNDNGYIYRMKKDGTSKQLLYKGKSGASNLNIVNDYIYFIEDDPYVEEDSDRICRIKKDGTGRVEVLYGNISVANHMQVDGGNIYYSDMFGLYKGDVTGGKPTRFIDKIENDSDEILFLAKDGWIYFWGTNYTTGKRTGIYKIKSDGTQKQCIVNNYSAEKLYVDNVNIDKGYVYYLDISGMLYKADLNGEGLQRIASLGKASNINVFNGYIYYSCEGSIYKVKVDGTGKSLLDDRASGDYTNINIVGGQLWYYNSYSELSKISLESSTNGTDDNILKPEVPFSLEEGKVFYVKGVNNPSSKVIKYVSSDVNNDGKKENIVLTGSYENYSYVNLKIFVQDSINGQILSYDSLINATCEDRGNEISLGDFNKDSVDDIKIDLLTNMQRGIHSTYIYSLSDNKLNKIFDEKMIPSLGKDFKYQLLNNNIKVSDDNNGYYLLDLSSDDKDHYNYLKDTGISPSLTVYYEGNDSDKDGVLELQRTIYLVGVSYSDFLCSVKTTYKFNSITGKWEYKDFAVESEFFPCESFKEIKSDGQDNNEDSNNQYNDNVDNNTEMGDKSSIQDLIEDNRCVYYVEDHWQSAGENRYDLNDSILYKVSKDLGEKTIIAKSPKSKIQVSDGWVYYIARYGVNLHRVKTDGTCDTTLNGAIVKSFCILGDWIYYCDNMDGIYKMKKDGTDLVRLNYDRGEEIAAFGEWVYYINSQDWTLYRMKTDGTSRLNLGEIATHSLGVNKDGIYYCVRHRVGSSLYKMNHDGTGQESISDEVMNRYAVYDGEIYYVSMYSNNIYKVKANGTGVEKVSDEKATDIVGISGDYIYYIAGEEMSNQYVYKMKK